MDYSKINFQDVRTHYTFQKYGETFEYLDSNEQTGLYLYQRRNSDGDVTSYEVVKPIYKKVHDIFVYPSAALFGANGKAIQKNYYKWAVWLLNNGFPPAEDYQRIMCEVLKGSI